MNFDDIFNNVDVFDIEFVVVFGIIFLGGEGFLL